MSGRALIICGSRDLDEDDALERMERELDPAGVSRVISGGASGGDRAGERWAKRHGVHVEVFKAQWSTYGKSAGMVRNGAMAKRAAALGGGEVHGFYDGDAPTPGTADMLGRAGHHGLTAWHHPRQSGSPRAVKGER